jgi:hypothetical protein
MFDLPYPRRIGYYNKLIAEGYRRLRRLDRAGRAFDIPALLVPLQDIEKACGELRAALAHGPWYLVTKPQRRPRLS